MRQVLAVTLILLASAVFGFGQAGSGAHVNTVASAVVNHSMHQSQATVHWSDIVNLSWRHCQKYQRTTGSWFWKKTVTDSAACAADPSTLYSSQDVHNLVTNAGFDLISSAVSNTATQPAACNYIAVTNTAITPAAGDTTLSGEISSNGLTRAQGTYAHTNGTQTYTVSKVFTATGTQASQATGLFNASSVGTMCYEATYTQVTVNSGDTLTVTWTVTLS